MYLKEIYTYFEDADLINLTQDRKQWWGPADIWWEFYFQKEKKTRRGQL
jgi:hypothetical protein